MSALMDYVHRYHSHYQQYGIARVGQSPRSYQGITNADAFLQQRLGGANTNTLSEATITELKKRLQENSDASENSDKITAATTRQDYLNALWEALYSRITYNVGSYFHGEMSRGNANWAPTSNYDKNLKTRMIGNSSTNAEQRKKLVAEKRAALTALEQRIAEINQKGTATPQEIQDIVQQYANITRTGLDFGRNTNVRSIVGQLQSIVDNTSYLTSSRAIAGEIGEQIVAACDDAIVSNSYSTIEEALTHIMTSVKGNIKSNIVYSADFIEGRDLKKNNFRKMDEAGNNYIVSGSKDKVDVEIEVNSEDVFGSVKHYKESSIQDYGVHLQTVSLFYSLMYMQQYSSFGTHWINLRCANYSYDIGLDDVLKKEIAYEALVEGNPMKAANPDVNVFIMLNRTTGNVFVERPQDLLTKDFAAFVGLDELDSISYAKENIFAESLQERLNKIQAAVETTKLTISLNKSLFGY